MKQAISELARHYAMLTVASAQRDGAVCAVVDVGGVFCTEHAVQCGVSLDDVLISQPDNLGQAAEIVDTLVLTGAIDLVVVMGGICALPVASRAAQMSTAIVVVP